MHWNNTETLDVTKQCVRAANKANAMKGFMQGFMQDKIIASHTCFGGHMDVTNNVYGFGRRFFAPSYFYPSTRDGVLVYSYSSTSTFWVLVLEYEGK